MQRIISWILTFGVALVLLAALLSYVFMFTVRFTETAVVTRWGKSDENSVIDGRTQAGAHWDIRPYPIRRVTKYDSRVRWVPVKLETQQTADNKQVVVEAFCTWRVDNALKFFQTFGNRGERPEEHFRAAQDMLTSNLRATMALVSQYKLDDLFTAGDDGGRIPELEKGLLAALRTGTSADRKSLADFGIAVVDVGITRVLLPEQTTKTVFDRMRARAERLAQETDSRGASLAQKIRADADRDANRIRRFSERLAQDIRSRGELEATPFLAQMNTNQELAKFLQTMDFIRTSYAKSTTLVLSGSTPGVRMLFPDATEGLKAGQIPSVVGDPVWAARQSDTQEPAGTLAPNAPASTTDPVRGGGR